MNGCPRQNPAYRSAPAPLPPPLAAPFAWSRTRRGGAGVRASRGRASELPARRGPIRFGRRGGVSWGARPFVPVAAGASWASRQGTSRARRVTAVGSEPEGVGSRRAQAPRGLQAVAATGLSSLADAGTECDSLRHSARWIHTPCTGEAGLAPRISGNWPSIPRLPARTRPARFAIFEFVSDNTVVII